jgi:hypothetical protein
MSDYKLIKHCLLLFDTQHGITDEEARRIYLQGIAPKRDEMREELERAFADKSLSWRELLFNREYKIYYTVSEAEAKDYAKKILLDPLNS